MTEENNTEEPSVTIGGESVVLPPLSFKGLKRVWGRLREIFQAQQGVMDPIDAIDALIAVVAASVARSRPELTIDEIEERLRPAELQGLMPAVQALLVASGIELAPAEGGAGEGDPVGGQAEASPETSQSSSAS